MHSASADRGRAADEDLGEGEYWNPHHPQFFEQTLYALMASALNKGGMLPATYNISWGYLRAPGSICRHYVGAFKHDLLYIEGAPSLLAPLAISRTLQRN